MATFQNKFVETPVPSKIHRNDMNCQAGRAYYSNLSET
jgi:hypothetical protein